jgi:hypothetical protein
MLFDLRVCVLPKLGQSDIWEVDTGWLEPSLLLLPS